MNCGFALLIISAASIEKESGEVISQYFPEFSNSSPQTSILDQADGKIGSAPSMTRVTVVSLLITAVNPPESIISQ